MYLQAFENLRKEPFFMTTKEPAPTLVKRFFQALPVRKFYQVYSLLATRLSKSSSADKPVLQHIMSSLLIEYPHQCALLSMGEARCKEKQCKSTTLNIFPFLAICLPDEVDTGVAKCPARQRKGGAPNPYLGYLLWALIQYFICADAGRSTAMRNVFADAQKVNPRVRDLVEAYEYVASNFAAIGAAKHANGTFDMQGQFKEFLNYMDAGCATKKRSSVGKKGGPPVAFRGPFPLFFHYLDHPFREMPRDAVTIQCVERVSNVGKKVHVAFIFLSQVLTSLARPKRLKLLASDGVRYQVLCKAKDELRKDMRFLELATVSAMH